MRVLLGGGRTLHHNPDEFLIAKIDRDLRVRQIYEVASDIQRMVIAYALCQDDSAETIVI